MVLRRFGDSERGIVEEAIVNAIIDGEAMGADHVMAQKNVFETGLISWSSHCRQV